MRRLLVTVFGLALSASTAGAYYHFYHYTNRSAPYNPVPEKFDINTLPNKTVTFFISDTAASAISQSSLYPSALGAIRQAANAWNGVDSSDVRTVFGGIAAAGTPQNSPGVDIMFVEMDPFLLGLTSTNAKGPVTAGPSGAFVPIQRPTIRLNSHLGSWTKPSFTEEFFLTVAHEMGHALGLQHTFTSSLMSTEAAGRATSLYSPLTADDIAGVSYLYPRGNFSQSTGSIAGRITFPDGRGVHLASVVAIRPTGAALSALTDPDGRFRIDGVPPNQYLLYAHPLPPPPRAGAAAGDLTLPVGADGQPVAADQLFQTLFYQGGQGTRDYTQAQTLTVSPGALLDNINLTLNRTAAYTIPSVTTYTYFNQTAVWPGYLNGSGTLVAYGAGLTNNGLPAPGLSVSFLGGAPVLTDSVRAYSGTYLALDLQAAGASGPRHVVFSLPNDIFVLPSGLNLAQNSPPFIASVTPGFESNGARSLALSGSTLNSSTMFYLDGLPAPLLRFDDQGRAIVAPPPGLAGLRPVITAFNPDGQNSMFLQSSFPVNYVYDTGDPGVASFSPSSLPAGTESWVEITGSNFNFVDGVTMAGVGSSDVQVRRSWVVAPNKIWANIWVSPNAAVAASTGSVINGFQVISQPFAIQAQGFNGRTPSLNSQLTNATPNQSGIFPGAAVNLSGANLANPTITVGGVGATILGSTSNQVTFQVPFGLPAGPAVLRFSNGVDTGAVVVQIDAGPPGVLNVAGSNNARIDGSRPARAGDLLNVLVAGLTDPGGVIDPKRVRVSIAGVDHTPSSIAPMGGAHQVAVVLSPSVGAGEAALTVSVGGRNSSPYYLPVAK
jgi:Matrixin.